MFRKSDTSMVSNRSLQIAVKQTLDTHYKPGAGPIAAQLQEARSQLIIALDKYKPVAVEEGNFNSKHLYSSHLSGRQAKLLEIVGCFQIDDKELSILNLLLDEEVTSTESLANILLRLSALLQPMHGFPPLKKSSQINIQNAIITLFETMRTCKFFPAESWPITIKIIIALAKSIDKEKLQHLLCQDPNLIKEIHNNVEHKDSLKHVNGLLEEVESLYQKLFPSQPSQPSIFGALINYPSKLFQASKPPIVTSNSVSTEQVNTEGANSNQINETSTLFLLY